MPPPPCAWPCWQLPCCDREQVIVIGADTLSYLAPGRNLLLHGRFFADGVPDLVRTPGYPLFLALTTLDGIPVAVAVQLLLSLLCVLLVWKLTRTVFSDGRIALVAAWLAAFEPVALANSFALMSDTLFTVLLLISLERLIVFLRTHKMRTLAAAGLVLTLATFVRPVTYYLPVALAMGLFIVFARVPGLRIKAPAVVLLTVLPCLAAWQFRNRFETGYKGFSSITDMNVYFYDEGYIIAQLEHRDFWKVQQDMGNTVFRGHTGQSYLYPVFVEKHPFMAGWDQARRLAFMHAEAVSSVRTHMKIYLHLCVETLLKVTFDPDAGQFDEYLATREQMSSYSLQNRSVARSEALLLEHYPRSAAEKGFFELILLGLYLFAARGLLRQPMQRETFWLLCGTLTYFWCISALGGGAGADARYRLPMMPIICMLAAAGLMGRRAALEATVTDNVADPHLARLEQAGATAVLDIF